MDIKYDSKIHDAWAFSLVIKGATDEEIAEAFGVNRRTILRWQFGKDAQGNKTFTSFGDAIKNGKEQADARVVKALYDRCLGYNVEESENIIEWDTSGQQKPLKIKKTKKYIAPDVIAVMYWLNNRSRGTGEWKQKQDIDVSFGDDSIRTAVRELTLDEARAKLAAIRSMRESNE